VIDPIYNNGTRFNEGLAAVCVQGGGWGIIDTRGNFIVEPKLSSWCHFSKGLANLPDRRGKWVSSIGKVDMSFSQSMTTAGQVVIEGKFDKAISFREGRALMEKQRKCGFIDRNGSILIEPQFTFARDFSEGLARVIEKESQLGFSPPSGFIDPEGNMVMAVKFRSG
jgi:hypothetical protein